MRCRKLLFAFFILYTIIFNNAIKIFAQDENLSEEVTYDSMDMSEVEYTEADTVPAYLDENGNPVIVAKSAVVIDADTGVILYGKDENAMHYPASVTKVLTSLIACEETEPTDLVTFSEAAVYGIGEGSSSIAVRVGETLNMDQCLHAILMASTNDVCVGVAELIDGTEAAFAERMNERAKELGAINSHFANSHGYHDENHYTTAYDMAMILKEAIKNEKFMESFSCLSYTIPETNLVSEQRPLAHKAKILWEDSPYYYQYIKGAKTGFTDQAGNTLITYSEKDGVKLICCVLADRGYYNTYTDSILLFDYCFNMYSTQTLVSAGELNISVPAVQYYNNKTIDLGEVSASVKQDYDAYVPGAVNKDTITISYDVPDTLTGGVAVGDIVGQAEVFYGGNLLASLDITADTAAELIPEEELIRQEKLEELVKLSVRILIGLIALIIVVFIIHRMINSRMYKHKKKYKKQRRKYRKARKNGDDPEIDETEGEIKARRRK
ncbi:MAG: D-alanyl-D-alanine carboxypeptidase, partial [Clostridiales bacterium]|nr:D-alanyl-D-alanine carboxypeptidase [Clostridiales bacterium]